MMKCRLLNFQKGDVTCMSTETKNFILYKIYSENCLLYLGRTKQPLQRRLHAHFFKAPMVRDINIECVTKIEYALFPTEADMNVMEIYYINKLKPPLNRDDKAKDALTIELPDVPFQEYVCPLMSKWREQIRIADLENQEKQKLKRQLEMEKRDKRREIFGQADVPLQEREEQWSAWLEEVYEPVRNGLL